MTPDSLKAKLAETIPAELCGDKIALRRIGARDGILLNKLLVGLPRNELNQPQDERDMATYYAAALSKSICDGDALPFDTDEGRKALEALPLPELVDLSERALQFSGMAAEPEAAKKN